MKETIISNKIFNDENNFILDDRDNNINILNLSVKEKILKNMNLSEREKDKKDIKDSLIKKMKEEITNLSKTQIIEYRTIIEDEEFNELVDENEELKK